MESSLVAKLFGEPRHDAPPTIRIAAAVVESSAALPIRAG
jgi:hypothetical protein